MTERSARGTWSPGRPIRSGPRPSPCLDIRWRQLVVSPLARRLPDVRKPLAG